MMYSFAPASSAASGCARSFSVEQQKPPPAHRRPAAQRAVRDKFHAIHDRHVPVEQDKFRQGGSSCSDRGRNLPVLGSSVQEKPKDSRIWRETLRITRLSSTMRQVFIRPRLCNGRFHRPEHGNIQPVCDGLIMHKFQAEMLRRICPLHRPGCCAASDLRPPPCHRAPPEAAATAGRCGPRFRNGSRFPSPAPPCATVTAPP